MRVRMRRLRLVALGLLLAGTAGAEMKRCGDDVDGTPVACDCGDVLVSSRRLGPADPITTRACEWNGLVVDVLPGAPPVVLDLGGSTLAGSGRGYGIHVTDGGDGGATIVGPGEVRGFRIGIVADGRTLRRISDVVASHNLREGFRVAGPDVTLAGCEAHDNGRHGFALRGRSVHVEGNRARDNGRPGSRRHVRTRAARACGEGCR
jgi:hypothetical protein